MAALTYIKHDWLRRGMHRNTGWMQETFAPVAKLDTIHILLSLAANQEYPLKQFDVKNVFLNGDLEEEVYMDLPPGVKYSLLN
jgi:hypothetical protein